MTNYEKELFDTINEKNIAREGMYDVALIRRAYEFALQYHGEQKRLTGEPYIIHPLAVANILAQLDSDEDTIIAALLHDVIEDTEADDELITKMFGKNITELVEGVTKLNSLKFDSREEEQAENLRKMLLAMAKDIRVIVIKLADRLHNMRTLDVMPEQKQRDKALETMQIYAPIANRLGIQKIKNELEDLALRYLDPVGYAEINEQIKKISKDGQAILRNVTEKIDTRLKEYNINAHIESRLKAVYSIYNKMYKQNKSFDEIYDIYAIRIIVNTVIECYNTLGILHDVYKPIPGRFKDYISTPKPNMYQSLHTTLLGSEKIPFEAQIRTWDMHKTAEYGIAAHWKYKDGVMTKGNIDAKLEWLRHLLDIQNDAQDAQDFIDTLKIDLFSDEVFVFTPKGDVINLPAGSNMIDFAYAIHSAIGNKMTGGKLNGKIVEITTPLKNGDIVEVLTSGSEAKGPSRDWMKLAKTNEAKTKIRNWFKKERREENIEQGKSDLERELKRNSISLKDEQIREKVLLAAMKKTGITEEEELYAAIGYNAISLAKIMPRIKDEYQRLTKPAEQAEKPVTITNKPKNPDGVIVEELDNCLIKFAKCCNPLPGDDIIGFITRGFGVSIHKADCVNIKNMDGNEQKARLVNVRWDVEESEWFEADLDILATNRIGLAADITAQLASMRVMIHKLLARETKDGSAILTVTLSVKTVDHLESVAARLRKITGVIDVSRV